MDLPKYHETFLPILETLNKAEEGKLHHTKMREIVKADYYSKLSNEEINKTTSTGVNLLFDRIGWGKSHLKMGKFVDYPERGMVQITDKGKKILAGGKFTLKDLQQDTDFILHKEAVQNKKSKQDVITDDTNKNSSPQDLIETGFSEIKSEVQTELLEKLKKIDPYFFEKVILLLLKKMGYGDFIETSKSNDGGIDGIINEDKLGLDKIYIQAKRYDETKVREKDIRNFIGAMSGDTQKGVFVTTSEFDEKAIRKANDAHHSIILINGNKLVELMHQYNVGVQVKMNYELKELDNDFFEND